MYLLRLVAKQVSGTELRLTSFLYPGADDLDLLPRPIFTVRCHQAHPLHQSQAVLDSSKNGVLAIKPWRRRQRDEELTAVRVRSAIRHGQDTSAGVLETSRDLVFELWPVDRFTTTTSACRVAALDHEIWYDSVEDGVIVVTSACEAREVVASLVKL